MTARDDSTRTATVDDDVPWRPMRDCPPHRRCILRNASGSPCIGTWDGRDDQCEAEYDRRSEGRALAASAIADIIQGRPAP